MKKSQTQETTEPQRTQRRDKVRRTSDCVDEASKPQLSCWTCWAVRQGSVFGLIRVTSV